jgi:tetratricopeptide (TPR) repeat protein
MRSPDNANFHDSHGEMLANTGNHGKAIEEYKMALNCEEWVQFRHQTYIKLAQSLQAIDNLKEALNMINNAILNIPIPERQYTNVFYSQAIKIKKEIHDNI